MRRNPDDDSDPFDGIFTGIEEMLSGMAGGESESVDVHEYDDEIRVVADIPEADPEEIKIECDGRVLAIRAPRGGRPFAVRVDLPAYVDDRSAERSFNNGVFEVVLERDTDPASIGFQ